MKWSRFAYKIFNIDKKYRILTIIFIIILAAGFVMRNGITIVSDIFCHTDSTNLEKYEDYLEVVGSFKNYDNITVMLESAVADKNILMLSFLVKNENEEIKEVREADIHISSLTINGREMCLVSKNNLELIDDNEARVVKRISWDYDNLPENLNISIGIKKMFDIEGNWDIKFNVDTVKILKDTYEEKLDDLINYRDIKGIIKEVTISPLTIKIESTCKSNKKSKLGFLVLDDDNNELMMLGEKASTNLKQYEYTSKYLCNEPLKKLKVVPIYYGSSNSQNPLISNKINLQEFHQFYLKIDDNLAVKIEDFIFDGGYIVLKYNYEYMGRTISADLNDLFIKSFNVIYDEITDKRAEDLKEEYSGNEYKIAVFKCCNTENIEIGCYDTSNVSLLEDYAFEIEKPIEE